MNHTTIKPVNGHKYASARTVIYPDGTVKLVSYTTTVIEISPDGWLSVNGLYSMTTIKHIGWFMRERGMTYQLAKQLYIDSREMNIYTGEIRTRA